VTPEELDLVSQAGRVVAAFPDRFAGTFYETLFEISPTTRELFPDDMTAQKGKLVDEMAFLLDAARDLDAFVARAKDLGRRHVDYGVQHGDYESVGVALTSALHECMEAEWSDAHEAAWAKLYSLIADVMRDGASGSMFATDGRVG
jgi:hemoglobin-like flavoprotein